MTGSLRPTVVHVEVSDTGVLSATESVTVQSMIRFWMVWAEIAIEHALAARQIRTRAMSLDRTESGTQFGDLLGEEMKSALIAISASAHALDALYGAIKGSIVVPQEIRDAWDKNDTKRPSRIIETLKCGFKLGPAQSHWTNDINWLFKERDAAVHAKEEFADLAEHQTGTLTSQVTVTYSLKNATRAVDLLLDVLSFCQAHPKPQVATYAISSMKRPVEQLQALWDDDE